MKTPLHVLVVEDSEFDAQIMINLLRRGGYEVTSQRVENADSMKTALQNGTWQIGEPLPYGLYRVGDSSLD